MISKKTLIIAPSVALALALAGGAGYQLLTTDDGGGKGGSQSQDYVLEIPASMLGDNGVVKSEVKVIEPERTGEGDDVPVQTWLGTESDYVTVRDLQITHQIKVQEGDTVRTVVSPEGQTFYVIVSDPRQPGTSGAAVTVDGKAVTQLPVAGGTTVVMAGEDAVVGLQGATGGIADLRVAIAENGNSPLDDVEQLPEPSSAYAASPAEAVQRWVLAIQSQDYYAACALMSPAAIVDVEGNAGSCGESGLQGALAWKNYSSEYAWLLNEDGTGFSYVPNANSPLYVKVHRLVGAAEVGIRTVGAADGYQVDVLDYQDSF